MKRSPGKGLLTRNQPPTHQQLPQGRPACLPPFTQLLSLPLRHSFPHQGPGYVPVSFHKQPLPLAGLTGRFYLAQLSSQPPLLFRPADHCASCFALSSPIDPYSGPPLPTVGSYWGTPSTSLAPLCLRWEGLCVIHSKEEDARSP